MKRPSVSSFLRCLHSISDTHTHTHTLDSYEETICFIFSQVSALSLTHTHTLVYFILSQCPLSHINTHAHTRLLDLVISFLVISFSLAHFLSLYSPHSCSQLESYTSYTWCGSFFDAISLFFSLFCTPPSTLSASLTLSFLLYVSRNGWTSQQAGGPGITPATSTRCLLMIVQRCKYMTQVPLSPPTSPPVLTTPPLSPTL